LTPEKEVCSESADFLQECHAPKVGIRRKKSKVAEAGIQEDGTHAI
jgi:hypothetical protein